MMFWDQWFIYTPLFRGQELIDIFRYQHGPHRQGLGGILIAGVASLSNWNGKWDAYLVGFTFIVAALLAIWLKVRLAGRFDWFDVLIPTLFLSLNQWETHTVVPNVSHSALPLVLVLFYAIALTSKRPLMQAAALVVTNFFLLYTGFGLFAGLITPILFLYRAVFPHHNGFDRATRPIWLTSFFIAIASLGSFFSDWFYSPAVDCIGLSPPKLYEYVIFAGLQIVQGFAIAPVASELGLFNGIALVIGLCVMFAAIFIAIQSFRQRDGMAISFLIIFSLLFVAATAVGRICLGTTSQPLASKYSTLVLPLILGIYLWANKQRERWYKPIGIMLVGLIILSFIPPFYRSPYTGTPQDFYNIKRTWKTCYLETLDPFYCDQLAGFPIHPYPQNVIRPLLYLERNKLNLFKDAPNDMVIVYPADNITVETDQVALLGVINPPHLERYEVQWGVGELPDEWFWLSGPHLAPVINDGIITTWDMTEISAGTYTVRVTAFLQDGQKRVAKTRVIHQ